MKRIHNKFLKDKFAHYQNEKLSKQERAIIDQWFDEHLSSAKTDFPKDDLATEQLRLELLSRLKLKIASEETLTDKQSAGLQHTKTHRLPFRWLSVACLLILVAGVTFISRRQLSDGHQTTAAAEQTFHTANGKMQKITLADGTEIWMNAGTTIRVASTFRSSRFRKVYLDQGEAFFKVKRDTLRPFSIATKNLLTTVLGTSFNIKAYPNAQLYQVAVSTGKVKVSQQTNSRWNVLSTGLVKGEVLSYHTASQKTEIESGNTDLISNWKTTRSIYADGMTLLQISQAISRQYAIQVTVTPGGSQNKKYYLTLPHQELKVILQQLAVATGINYQLTNSHLIINPAIQ